jgi:hypothetical protein
MSVGPPYSWLEITVTAFIFLLVLLARLRS